MALITVDAYIEKHFAKGSRPPKSTVWRWIREGKLPAIKKGRRYYIEERDVTNETGNDLVDKVLKDVA